MFGPLQDFRSPKGFDTTPRVTGIDPPAARLASGDSITIFGFNFRALADGTLPQVLFAGEAATNVVIVSLNELTCDLPTGVVVGQVNVRITVQGQFGVGFGLFTYFDSTITEVIPRFGLFSGGESVIIQGFNFLSGSTITFDGVAATDILFIDTQRYRCTTPPHSIGFVDVVLTDP